MANFRKSCRYKLDVFPIGTYVGKGKPCNVNVYLHDFIEEVKTLEAGIILGEMLFYVRIRAFICDTPARAFLCDTKGHNTQNGCHRCQQVGTRIEHRTVFSDTVPSRTDNDFKNRTDNTYHKNLSLEVGLCLENVGIQMVTQFPLDSMHLLDLGVAKKILSLLINNKTNQKINNVNKISISSVLVSFAPFITVEFARKPRTPLLRE